MRIKTLKKMTALTLAFGVVASSMTVNAAEVDSTSKEANSTSREANSYEGLMLGTKVQKPFILDMDFCTDVDDACAVRIATELADAGIIDLKAMGVCVTGKNPVEALQGILDSEGYGHIPVGSTEGDNPDESPYWDEFEHLKKDNSPVDRAARVYRKTLVESTDRVDICTTGYLSNIRALLQSGPDDISPLTGVELVKQKGGQLWVTGAKYPNGKNNNFFFTEDARVSAAYVNENWPMPIIYVSSDVASPLVCGRELQNYDTQRKDPITRALYLFGTSTGRAAWDPFTTWVAAYGDLEKCKVDLVRTDLSIDVTDGFNQFNDNVNGRHYRMYRTSDDLMWYNIEMDKLLLEKFIRCYQ